uniref:Uncharacterized protein n=1 Tax=Eutreptiella gymnastica TaxID=73025 RepID=A0A7S1ISL0_9EUGL|mmetsp:Transcript_4041/g.7195  ORF Transcript_4041/g.7195 Transcript_4041/m.7195 type:complete len:169 (+) Transcript_4041:64-570(+)
MEFEKLANARVGDELEMPDFLVPPGSFALDDSLSLGSAYSTSDVDHSVDEGEGQLTDEDFRRPLAMETPPAQAAGRVKRGDVSEVDGVLRVGNVPLSDITVDNVWAALGMDSRLVRSASKRNGVQPDEEEVQPLPMPEPIVQSAEEKRFIERVTKMDDAEISKIFGTL